MGLRFPDALGAEQFLSCYWQREPVLLPQALTGLLPEFTPAELAGLACSTDCEARLILSAGPPGKWQLHHGPFRDEDFARLPPTHWSLLVQDVDKFVPEVAALLQHFGFIPSWRIDDIMISFAAPHGTVGPHIDEYDVFLVQGTGTRVWEIGYGNTGIIPDLPVRVLAEFEAQQRWELSTGDVLYLPPGLAHHGYSDGDSMTISVGFRAPSVADLLLTQAACRADQVQGRYADSDLTVAEADDGLISEAAIGRVLELVNMRPQTPAEAAAWFGELVTENKPWLQPEPVDEPETRSQFDRRLDSGQGLKRAETVRMAHSRLSAQVAGQRPAQGLLFVDGTAWPLQFEVRTIAPMLCRGDTVTIDRLDDADSACRELLFQLYCAGKLYWFDDE